MRIREAGCSSSDEPNFRNRRGSVALLILALLITSVVPSAAAGAQPAGPVFCADGERLAISYGFSMLGSQAGLAAGDPLQCPRRDQQSGDLLQATSTGIFAWRPTTGVVSF